MTIWGFELRPKYGTFVTAAQIARPPAST